jgi:hypothetical protein
LNKILTNEIVLHIEINVSKNIFTIKDSEDKGGFISDCQFEDFDEWVFTIGSCVKDFSVEIL